MGPEANADHGILLYRRRKEMAFHKQINPRWCEGCGRRWRCRQQDMCLPPRLCPEKGTEEGADFQRNSVICSQYNCNRGTDGRTLNFQPAKIFSTSCDWQEFFCATSCGKLLDGYRCWGSRFGLVNRRLFETIRRWKSKQSQGRSMYMFGGPSSAATCCMYAHQN